MKNQKGVSLITLIITIIAVIILAVIVLRSGASDTPDQAAFSGFTQEMGELQDAVKTAMLEVKADEILKGNQRSEAQLYNFIARGGYEGFSGERKSAGNDINNNAKWLTMADAEGIQVTLIEKEYAEESIGIKVPTRKVETNFGTDQEMSYFITPKGIVFCWPPYVYDGKSYVNADTTVKDENGNELGETLATDLGERMLKFENEERVRVMNTTFENAVLADHLFPGSWRKGLNLNGGMKRIGVIYMYGDDIEIGLDGVAQSHYFSGYDNAE